MTSLSGHQAATCHQNLSSTDTIFTQGDHVCLLSQYCEVSDDLKRWPIAGLLLGYRRRRWPNMKPVRCVLKRCWSNASLSLGARRRRWANINSTLAQLLGILCYELSSTITLNCLSLVLHSIFSGLCYNPHQNTMRISNLIENYDSHYYCKIHLYSTLYPLFILRQESGTYYRNLDWNMLIR